MFEIDGRTRLHEMTRILVDTAMGRQKADLVVRNATPVNVNSGEILEKQDVAVKKDRIALVGNAQDSIGSDTNMIYAQGKYLVPTFITGHVHRKPVALASIAESYSLLTAMGEIRDLSTSMI